MLTAGFKGISSIHWLDGWRILLQKIRTGMSCILQFTAPQAFLLLFETLCARKQARNSSSRAHIMHELSESVREVDRELRDAPAVELCVPARRASQGLPAASE